LLLEEMGHDVVESTPAFDGTAAMEAMTAIWFFGFDTRLEGYAARGGRAIGPDTVEPVVLAVYEHAKRMKPVHLVNAISTLNAVRRQIATVFAGCDVWITPTTPRVAEPWGTYNLGRTDVTIDNLIATIYRGVCQYTLPHNIMGTPAISLPLAMHSTGLPIGIQLGAPHAQEHVVLKLANALEIARPWRDRVPPVHASRA
jgi:amidase